MEPEGSLMHPKQPATSPCPEPDQLDLCISSHFLKIHFNIILPPTPRSLKYPLFFRFPHQSCTHLATPLIRATLPAHSLVLGLITRTIFDEEHRAQSSSLYTRSRTHSLEPKYPPQHPILENPQTPSMLVTNFHNQIKQPARL